MYFLKQGQEALEEKKRTNSTSDREIGVLEKLLEIDETVALVMTLDSITAGVDTTGAAFFNLLHSLAHAPDKQELLRKEIMSVLTDDETVLTADNMLNMPYLRACMKESARYTPLVNMMRSAGRDLVLQGYQIPKNTNCMLVQHSHLSSEKQYERAGEFIPERFLRKSKEEAAAASADGCPRGKTADPFVYTPFGK